MGQEYLLPAFSQSQLTLTSKGSYLDTGMRLLDTESEVYTLAQV